ncbi:MAG: citrate/2-methylcitrate synthase [Termitinemataceae bacterium]|nr:MAG: citrate/2-methylcitrate synthase [Termitinemataceae bacterium]
MSLISSYIERIKNNDHIDAPLFDKFNVKRGLRNSDGSGVLVGLTRVGEVHGYIVNEGEKQAVPGKLFYRGVDVEDLVRNTAKEGRFGFEEAVYLLLFGNLPTHNELSHFCEILNDNRELPQGFTEDVIMKLPSRDIMNKLASSVLNLYSYDEDPENLCGENVLRQCLELIARFPTIAAYCFRAKRHYFNNVSLIIHRLQDGLHTAETILSLMRPDQNFTQLEAEILDLALILHAEHGGGNNSTFAVHLVSSADTDTYSAISAGIGALKGFKHGGANSKVRSMIEDIKENVHHLDNDKEISDYLIKIARGETFDRRGLIYGMGHAVYTISDPRALLLKEKALLLATEKNMLDEFEIYHAVERLGPDIIHDVKKAEKDVCTNVDLYSGFVYKMLGIPPEFYTPLFAVSRLAGWCAHRMEEVIAGSRIIRPAYKCVQQHIGYVPLDERK